MENLQSAICNLQSRMGLLLCDDMIFTSRIVGTGRDLGLTIKQARSATALVELASSQAPSCVIVDLGNPGLDIVDLRSRLAESCRPMPFMAAYGSHVDAETLRKAREAGCDVVWPRSKFAEELPHALPSWFASAR
jgi:CheY-like chemotaxis protein